MEEPHDTLEQQDNDGQAASPSNGMRQQRQRRRQRGEEHQEGDDTEQQEEEEEQGEDEPQQEEEDEQLQEGEEEEEEQEQEQEEDEEGEERGKATKRSKAAQQLSEAKLRRLKQRYDRRGIVYISRIPPHMKPQKLKHMLSQQGEVGRVYLAPEDPAMRRQRKREGRNSGKNFTEGWVEFESKAVAKRAAELLNGQPMGGKKRSAFHWDLWNLKYLPRFKWEHLTEEIAYERAVREQKLAAELRGARRERDFYLQQVGRAKAVEAIQERKRKRQQQDAGEQQPGEQQQAQDAAPMQVKRKFGQRRAKADPADEGAATLPPDLLALVGGKRD